MGDIWENINNDMPKHMNKIYEKYNLKFVKLSPISTAMVGDDFAIIIGLDRFDALISYVYREKNKLIEFEFDRYIAMEYDSDDRKDLIEGDGARTHVTNSLIVIQAGLLSKWSNILEGDKEWIKDYKKSNYYYQRELREGNRKILEKYI